MNFIKEIKSILNYFKLSSRDKQIVFYAENQGYYASFEGVISVLLSYNTSFCYITSDSNDPLLDQSNHLIHSLYINKLLPFLMCIINCKVLIMTLTELNKYHIKRSVNNVHYIYMFHALVSTHMMYAKGAFDHYDSILCTGPYQKEEIRSYEAQHGQAPKKLVAAGYYRLERIYNRYQETLNMRVTTTKKTVLIAPSWGADNIFERCGEELIGVLLQNGYHVIARPHPETVRRYWSLVTALEKIFNPNPNFNMELSVATDDSLINSDVLICDCSGVALEYAFGTERPVLFLEVPYKIQNKEYQELQIEPFELKIRGEIGICISPEALGDVPKVINQLIKERESYRKTITELRESNVYSFGNSAEIGAQHIFTLCN